MEAVKLNRAQRRNLARARQFEFATTLRPKSLLALAGAVSGAGLLAGSLVIPPAGAAELVPHQFGPCAAINPAALFDGLIANGNESCIVTQGAQANISDDNPPVNYLTGVWVGVESPNNTATGNGGINQIGWVRYASAQNGFAAQTVAYFYEFTGIMAPGDTPHLFPPVHIVDVPQNELNVSPIEQTTHNYLVQQLSDGSWLFQIGTPPHPFAFTLNATGSGSYPQSTLIPRQADFTSEIHTNADYVAGATMNSSYHAHFTGVEHLYNNQWYPDSLPAVQNTGNSLNNTSNGHQMPTGTNSFDIWDARATKT